MSVVQRCCIHTVHGNRIVSMPHAALYVVQPTMGFLSKRLIMCFNAARSIVCGATSNAQPNTRPYDVSMPHAALYVVHRRPSASFGMRRFQCRTQHCMWCNSVAHSPCPAQSERAFWKVVDFFVPFFPYGAAFSPKNHGVNRRVPVCGAELRPNGKWRR